MKDVARHVRGEDVDQPEETRRMLALLRGRLDEARGAGRPYLKLDPADVEKLCAEAGIESSGRVAFRSLVRQNLVRLRGRWRENSSTTGAPVYVERITERGLRSLADSG